MTSLRNPETSSATAAAVRAVLEPWCAAGATGALRVLGPPGGSIYLIDGRVTYAECPLSTGVAEMLIGSGRLTADTWRAALVADAGRGRVGSVLVDWGRLTLDELPPIARSALLSAALFLLDASTPTRFEAQARPPLGPLPPIDLAPLCAEIDHRRRLLRDEWPDAAIDRAPVHPATRLSRDQVTLTASEWDIITNAGRSPLDLARHLGRDTFEVQREVRRLTREGLVEPPVDRPAGPDAGPSGSGVQSLRPVPALRPPFPSPRRPADSLPAVPWAADSLPSAPRAPDFLPPAPRAAEAQAGRADPADAPPATDSPPRPIRAVALPQRTPSAEPGRTEPPRRDVPVDVLVRIRQALADLG